MFGKRKDDEDPFAALKDGGTYQSTPMTVPDIGVGLGGDMPPTPTPTPTPSAASAPTPAQVPAASQAPALTPQQTPGVRSAFTYGTFQRGTRSSYSGPGVGVVIRLVVALIVVVAVAVPILSATKAVHSIKVPAINFGSSTPSTTGTPSPGPARAVSYLTPAGVRAGIAHLKRIVPGARVILFRVDAKTLSATAVGRHGAAKQIYFSPSTTFISSATASGQRPVPLSQVRPGVVGRLVAQMRSRFHVPPSRIDYMVISSPQGLPAQWIVFSKAPSHPGFAATLSGGGLHRL
jgi:hypothetical protein